MRLEGRPMRENILAAAVQLFAEYGYHAAPLRDIARIAGIQAASIYHHYPNKQSLLVEIMETHMQLLVNSLEQIGQTDTLPLQRLHSAIASHIRLHTTYKNEFFIIDTEIRALEGENRSYIISLRKKYEALLQDIIRDGMRRGTFRQSDVKICSYAIIAMCTEVATWFRSNGRLTVQQVTVIYSQMIAEGLLPQPESAQMSEEATHN